ncbi:homoserine/homoserine lactone efflux protein [Dokdonella fugitiva]|uniref:Homoserine/homoserine lactone efflux protein n=1 Tax=Dokdonella fugitiva TaxID=328517 RepID=A0A839F2H8_9GAMM|nr:LysE family transporter [Dokdonella fugitiva]MBA8887708.1 homoserine/homoserine lactone efflux protein [Dokdonella fugitiva]
MTTQTWLAFFVTETALSLVPGPAVLYVVGQAMRHGAPRAFAANLGILSGNTLYFLLSAFGLAAVVAAAAPLFVAIKWLGVAYLAWLGIAEWREALRGAGLRTSAVRGTPAPFAMWRQGVLLQLANPKAILFFTALLPQFVDPAQAVAPQIAVLALTSVASEFAVLAGYAWVAARGSRALHANPRYARCTGAAAGTCLIGAGIGLALAQRH